MSDIIDKYCCSIFCCCSNYVYWCLNKYRNPIYLSRSHNMQYKNSYLCKAFKTSPKTALVSVFYCKRSRSWLQTHRDIIKFCRSPKLCKALQHLSAIWFHSLQTLLFWFIQISPAPSSKELFSALINQLCTTCQAPNRSLAKFATSKWTYSGEPNRQIFPSGAGKKRSEQLKGEWNGQVPDLYWMSIYFECLVLQQERRSKVHMEEVRDGWLNQTNAGTFLQETTVCVQCERETQGWVILTY